MTLVVLRCNRCRVVLAEVVAAPAESDELRWASWVVVPVCPWHLGAHGLVARWVEARRRLGLPHDRYRTGQWICWSELRASVQLARDTRKTHVYAL